MVITDAYDDTEAGLWTERPTSDRTDIDNWFATLLGPRDAIVLVVAFEPFRIMFDETRRTVHRMWDCAAALPAVVRGGDLGFSSDRASDVPQLRAQRLGEITPSVDVNAGQALPGSCLT